MNSYVGMGRNGTNVMYGIEESGIFSRHGRNPVGVVESWCELSRGSLRYTPATPGLNPQPPRGWKTAKHTSRTAPESSQTPIPPTNTRKPTTNPWLSAEPSIGEDDQGLGTQTFHLLVFGSRRIENLQTAADLGSVTVIAFGNGI